MATVLKNSVLKNLQDAIRPALMDCAYGLFASTFAGRAVLSSRVRHELYHSLRPRLWPQNQNNTAKENETVVWFHGASLGEVQLLGPLLQALQTARPEVSPIITSCTTEGVTLARENFSCPVFFAPLDFSWSVRRAFDGIQPQTLVLLEQELWPGLLSEANRRKIPVAMLNAKMLPQEMYASRILRKLLPDIFQNIQVCGAQTQDDALRLQQCLRAPAARVPVTGSLKFAVAQQFDRQDRANLRERYGFSPTDKILLAGSTHGPEENILLRVFRSLRLLHPQLRLVLCPRNEPFQRVAQLLRRNGIEFISKTKLPDEEIGDRVLLWDTFGELGKIWPLADFAYVGGSLGGHEQVHNFLEPMAARVPTCFGMKSDQNSLAHEAVQLGAAAGVADENELSELLTSWLEAPDTARDLAEVGFDFAHRDQNAVRASIAALQNVLPPITSAKMI